MTDRERIDQINEILAKGHKRVSIGDRVIEYDLESLRRERDMLLAKIRGGSQFKRVVFRDA